MAAFHTPLKGTSQKANTTAWLELKTAHPEVTAQHTTHYAMDSPFLSDYSF